MAEASNASTPNEETNITDIPKVEDNVLEQTEKEDKDGVFKTKKEETIDEKKDEKKEEDKKRMLTVHCGKLKIAGASNTQFQLLYQQGDLFACDKTESLAHCVSADMRMGKGIALTFKKKFGGVDELKAQGKKTGEMAYLKRDSKYIYYLVTKDKATDKPTETNLQCSLSCMMKHCVEKNVINVSMPKIGCGLDRLQWDRVSKIITKVFRDTNMTITVYTLPGKRSD